MFSWLFSGLMVALFCIIALFLLLTTGWAWIVLFFIIGLVAWAFERGKNGGKRG